MKLLSAIVLLSLLGGEQLHAGTQQLLHDFGSWRVVTWQTPAGEDVYWAQTALDAKHLLAKDDRGANLRFGCSAASRPLTEFLLIETNSSAGWSDSYTVDWKVGTLPPIRLKGRKITIFDAFDAPVATNQALEGERVNASIVIRLSDPDMGSSEFERRLIR